MEYELNNRRGDAQRPLADAVRPRASLEHNQRIGTGPDTPSPFQELFRFLKLLYKSFHRHENAVEGAWDQAIATTPWIRELRPRHIIFIPLAGTIGTGIFINSAHALFVGGPAALLLSYVIVGAIASLTMDNLAEMTANFPTEGFIEHIRKFMGPSAAFAVGWNCVIDWLTALPLELAASKLAADYWQSICGFNSSSWTFCILVGITIANLLGGSIFGDVEMLLSIIKILAVLGFAIFCYLEKDSGPVGWHHAWQNGARGLLEPIVIAAFSYSGIEIAGLVANETSGGSDDFDHNSIMQSDISDESLPGGGTIGDASAQTNDALSRNAQQQEDPASSSNTERYFDRVQRTSEPSYERLTSMLLLDDKRRRTRERVSSNIKRLAWQTVLYFVLSAFIIATVVTPDQVFHGNMEISPFVAAVENLSNARADVQPSISANTRTTTTSTLACQEASEAPLLAHIFNGVIVVTTVSVGNTVVFGSCRVLVAMAYLNLNFKSFQYIDKKGRPLTGMALALVLGLLAPLVLLKKSITPLDFVNWSTMLCGLSSIVTWTAINLAYLRYREAEKIQGRHGKPTYRAVFGVPGAIIAFIGCVTILVFEFVVAVHPVYREGQSRAQWFFYSYLTIIIVTLLFLGYAFSQIRPRPAVEGRRTTKIVAFYRGFVDEIKSNTKNLRNALKFWTWLGSDLGHIDLEINRESIQNHHSTRGDGD